MKEVTSQRYKEFIKQIETLLSIFKSIMKVKGKAKI